MDIHELLKHLLKGHAPDKSNWVQVGTLRPEDIIKSKSLEMMYQRLCGERDVLIAKINKLKADGELASKEWWEHLHNTYNLPRDAGEYHLAKDGRIMMDPKGKTDE